VSEKARGQGGVSFRFTVGRSGAGGDNARYITRESATQADVSSLYFHNIPDKFKEGESYAEVRFRILAYCRGMEKSELDRPRMGTPKGECRTHYRANLSFEGVVEPAQALRMAREYLEENFPLAQAVAAVHTDTAHTHVHINLLARQTDGRKVHLQNTRFKNQDSAWAKIYGNSFGQEKTIEHERKKEETREWKRDYARGIKREKPARIDHQLTRAEHRERELRNHDKGRNRGDQRRVAGGERAPAAPVGDREWATANRDGAESALERASANVGRTSAGIREAVESFKRLGEQIERRSREDRDVERAR
jgi:hypothetical protein